MKKIVLIFLLSCIVSCTNVAAPGFVEAPLLGVWYLKDTDRPGLVFSQIAYIHGGKKCEISMEFNVYGTYSVDYWINTWKVEDGLLISTIEDSSVPYMQKGELIVDAIMKLTQDELIVLMEETSDYRPEIEHHLKLNGEDPNLLCSIVERNLALYHRRTKK